MKIGYTMATHGYSGNSFDRWVEQSNLQSAGAENTMNKMQHQFWVAKQTILRRLGKKEDDCVVASDAELDAKLELFLSIQETCSQLYKVVEQYQERLQVLSQEENTFGHFLRTNGELDKTCAGKMMNAVGKAMIYSAQQRASLRSPLARLYQEVETFCQRAVEDTSYTVNEMEKCRNDYRGALLWMKNVSQELDPDTFKQLEKFRRVQNHVRASKTKFDRHKLACLQKIDLLAAARCNMFSHGLIVYQDNMATFWKRTSSAMATVSEAYKGYQPYEFTFVKGLTETSLKLAGEKPSSPEPKFEFFFESEFHDEEKVDSSRNEGLNNAQRDKPTSNKGRSKSKTNKRDSSESKPLLDKCSEDLLGGDGTDDLLGLNLSCSSDSDALLLELASLDFGQPASMKDDPSQGHTDKNDLGFQQDQCFLANFDQVFGSAKSDEKGEWSSYLPSNFLSNDFVSGCSSNVLSDASTSSQLLPSSISKEIGEKKLMNENRSKKETGKDMSSWYSLFADLDPLGNPDALSINKKEDDDRNC
ncbi:hypothetical protein GHT06_021699 [Daphnia sinensis]|uniref:AH domain-containing protein n=1 Tax=Daphnia sinensis TaxID=1820382 RepID=A0AAD5KWN6_9CRUS|nr:hypothetical protein GHT06_021699 [Daphnia sinensis]